MASNIVIHLLMQLKTTKQMQKELGVLGMRFWLGILLEDVLKMNAINVVDQSQFAQRLNSGMRSYKTLRILAALAVVCNCIAIFFLIIWVYVAPHAAADAVVQIVESTNRDKVFSVVSDFLTKGFQKGTLVVLVTNGTAMVCSGVVWLLLRGKRKKVSGTNGTVEL